MLEPNAWLCYTMVLHHPPPGKQGAPCAEAAIPTAPMGCVLLSTAVLLSHPAWQIGTRLLGSQAVQSPHGFLPSSPHPGGWVTAGAFLLYPASIDMFFPLSEVIVGG